MSIFTIPGIQLSKDPGYRSSNFPKSGVTGRSRRQSMLLWNTEWPSIQLFSLEVAVARWNTIDSCSIQPQLWFRPPTVIFMACCEVWSALYKTLIPYKPFSKIFKPCGVEEETSLNMLLLASQSKDCYKIKCFRQCATKSLSFKLRFIFHWTVISHVMLLCITYIGLVISLLTNCLRLVNRRTGSFMH